MEVWRDVVGYEGIYEVSDLGRVRTHEDKITFSVRCGVRKWQQRILKDKTPNGRDVRVSLWKNKKVKDFLVHRLVAEAFIPKIIGKDCINHMDGNPKNNHVENLEWCNYKENSNHAFDTGLMPSHEVILYDTNSKQTHTFRSKQKASEFLGMNHGFVSGFLKRGKTRHLNYVIKEKKAN
jgi:hypothetical protein